MTNESMANYICDTDSEIQRVMAINNSLKKQIAISDKIVAMLKQSNNFYADLQSWEKHQYAYEFDGDSVETHMLMSKIKNKDLQPFKENPLDRGIGAIRIYKGGKLARSIKKEVEELENAKN